MRRVLFTHRRVIAASLNATRRLHRKYTNEQHADESDGTRSDKRSNTKCNHEAIAPFHRSASALNRSSISHLGSYSGIHVKQERTMLIHAAIPQQTKGKTIQSITHPIFQIPASTPVVKSTQKKMPTLWPRDEGQDEVTSEVVVMLGGMKPP